MVLFWYKNAAFNVGHEANMFYGKKGHQYLRASLEALVFWEERYIERGFLPVSIEKIRSLFYGDTDNCFGLRRLSGDPEPVHYARKFYEEYMDVPADAPGDKEGDDPGPSGNADNVIRFDPNRRGARQGILRRRASDRR